MEIIFIMAAMKDSKPSTAFTFPTPASSHKRHTTAKQAHSGEDERKYSTDSEFSLKGKIIRPVLIQAPFREDSLFRCDSSCASELTKPSII